MKATVQQAVRRKGYDNCPTCDGFGQRLEIAPGQSINWETAVSLGFVGNNSGKTVRCPTCQERRELEEAGKGQ